MDEAEDAKIRVGIQADQLDGLAGFVVVGHLDEAEPTGPASVAVVDEGERFDGSMGREKRSYGLLGRREGQIANK